MVDLYIYTFYDETKYWIVQNEEEIFSKFVKERQISENFYDLLALSGVNFKDIDRLAFVNGPGSFTSLRFFLTFAKALKVSFPNVEIVPLNLLEIIGYSRNGVNNVIMGGNRKFSKFFHYAKYEKKDDSMDILEDVRLISYDEALKIEKPLYLGVKPDFEITGYEINLNDMINFSNYKFEKGKQENIINLTPYYYKQFSTKI